MGGIVPIENSNAGHRSSIFSNLKNFTKRQSNRNARTVYLANKAVNQTKEQSKC
jgi:hypothetical protein